MEELERLGWYLAGLSREKPVAHRDQRGTSVVAHGQAWQCSAGQGCPESSSVPGWASLVTWTLGPLSPPWDHSHCDL